MIKKIIIQTIKNTEYIFLSVLPSKLFVSMINLLKQFVKNVNIAKKIIKQHFNKNLIMSIKDKDFNPVINAEYAINCLI